jgi:hypothetical protein
VGDHGARQLSPLFARRIIRRDRQSGGYRLDLDDDEREILRQLVPQIVTLLDQPDQPVLERLFPPAYSEDVDADKAAEYRRLMQEDLVARHRDELQLIAATADAKTLTEEQLLGWTRALNSIRLVLGTYLDVSEDDEGRAPSTLEESVYGWLSFLLGEAVDALGDQM